MTVQNAISKFIRLEITGEEVFEAIGGRDVNEPIIIPDEDWMVLYRSLKDSKQHIADFEEEFTMNYFGLLEEFEILTEWDAMSVVEAVRKGAFIGRAVENFLTCVEIDTEMDGKVYVADLVAKDADLREAAECFEYNRGRNFEEFQVPTAVKENFIYTVREELAESSEETLAMYRKWVEEMAAVDNVAALDCMAYGYYSGDCVFECDWMKSRDCLLRLMDLTTNGWDQGNYANSLGYIYYYGRCNDGVPEYEKAFEMFSLGAAIGHIESRYKLSDMYCGGKGVKKSQPAARNILRRLFNEIRDEFLHGYGEKMADVALRMGNLAREDEDFLEAMHYYMMADYAMKKRLPENHYGDKKVNRAIQEGLEYVGQVLDVDTSVGLVETEYPEFIDDVFRMDYVSEVRFVESGVESGTFEIMATRRPKQSEVYPSMVEISYPEYGFYTLENCVIQVARGNASYNVVGGGDVFNADCLRFGQEDNEIEFLLSGEVVASVKVDTYIYFFEGRK